MPESVYIITRSQVHLNVHVLSQFSGRQKISGRLQLYNQPHNSCDVVAINNTSHKAQSQVDTRTHWSVIQPHGVGNTSAINMPGWPGTREVHSSVKLTVLMNIIAQLINNMIISNKRYSGTIHDLHTLVSTHTTIHLHDDAVINYAGLSGGINGQLHNLTTVQVTDHKQHRNFRVHTTSDTKANTAVSDHKRPSTIRLKWNP